MLKGKELKIILVLAVVFGLLSDLYCFSHGYNIAYGDAESHLNIAKRVISGLTPGMAQLGGIWLPLPHLFLVPLVALNIFWKTGLAGAVVSGIAFVISALVIFQLTFLLTERKSASFLAALVFIVNPNVLYLQSTPMTELPLIAFSLLNSYFFLKYLKDDSRNLPLILAGFFGFFASLCRYDGWFLVALEALLLLIFNLTKSKTWSMVEGKLFLFITPAFYGIFLWLLWNFLIFKNPFYFTNSIFSAKSQQMAWLARNELPAYHSLNQSFLYYFVTSQNNVGSVFFLVSIYGLILFLLEPGKVNKLISVLVLAAPFIFHTASLYSGQSVIFIPSLTPKTFEWQLFNVRYGLMIVPAAAFFFAYLFKKSTWLKISLLILIFLLQLSFYFSGQEEVITLADGARGLSAAKKVDAQEWLKKNYDEGLVLLDDYARTLSVIRSNIPMENVIYVGTKPYWEESFQQPEKYATWIIMQKNDEVWRNIYDPPKMQARLYKYFNKVYTSKEILIFKRMGS